MKKWIFHLTALTGLNVCIFALLYLLCAGDASAQQTRTPAPPSMDGDFQTWHLPEGALARLGKGAIGEGDRAVALSSDGKYLAVASGVGVWLYEMATSRALALLPTASPVYSVAFSRGTMLASGLVNGRIELWEVKTGTRIAIFEGRRWVRVTSVLFSPDGATLVSGSYDGAVRLWDVASRKRIATLEGHTEQVTSVSFSPDGATLASGSQDKAVKLWDVASREEVATLEGHWHLVSSVSFSPDGDIVASGSWDRTVRLWDVSAREEIATLEGHTDGVSSVVVFA